MKVNGLAIMSKQEFIDRLRGALNGRIPAAQVEDTINYYLEYIDSQMRSGKSEAEVMSALGDPRLIARTIIETAQPTGDNGSADNTAKGYESNTYHSNGQNNYGNYQDTANQTHYKHFRMPGWLVVIIVLLVVFLFFSIVFSLLSFLAPAIVVIVAVLFLVKLFGDWLN